MGVEQNGAQIEGRWNPIIGGKAILYLENQPKGFVEGVKKIIRWPIKLSDSDAVALQKQMAKDEAVDLWGPND